MITIPKIICSLFGHKIRLTELKTKEDSVRLVYFCSRCGLFAVSIISLKEKKAPAVSDRGGKTKTVPGKTDTPALLPEVDDSEIPPAPIRQTKKMLLDKKRTTTKKKGRYSTGQYIGDVFSSWLESSGMTRRELMKKSGVHEADISKYINNKIRVGDKAIQRLAKGFGVTIEQFLSGPGMNIGKIIYDWMTAKARSHSSVANATCIHHSVLSGLIDDSKKADSNQIELLAKTFRVTPKEFLAGPIDKQVNDYGRKGHPIKGGDDTRYVMHVG